jgi:hypothetical protein
MAAPTLLIHEYEDGQMSDTPTKHEVHAIAVAGLPGQVQLIVVGENSQILSSIIMDGQQALRIAKKLAESAGVADARADMKAGAVHQGSGRTH